MRKIVLGWVLSVGIFMSYAQENPLGYYRDALLFSQTNSVYGSSARMQAIGGAQTSLGGDLSSISSNPAGLGFFNRSVFSFTSALDFTSAETEYFGETENEFKTNFNLPNVGVVFNFDKGDYTNDRFKGGSLGISLSRMRTFHLNRSYRAPNDFNSIIDSFIENANGNLIDELGELEWAAVDQEVIFDDGGGVYLTDVAGFPIQSETLEDRGSQYQLNIAWGGNYDDQLYFGGGLGVQLLNYTQKKDYLENEFVIFDDEGNGSPDDFINSISIIDELKIRGTGVNFNIGGIYRPASFLSIGVNYVTPTFLAIDEEYFFDFLAQGVRILLVDENGTEFVEDVTNEVFNSPFFVSQYNLRSPSRFSAGATFFVGKGGFFSADLERVNYANANISTSDFIESADNDEIESTYQDVLNIRLGGEYRVGNFRLRGGYSIFPSPYRASKAQERTNVSLGLGYRSRDFFLDFAVVNSRFKELYSPYFLDGNEPVATSDIQTTSASITFGVNF